jgi:hypothetical protein
MKNKLFLLLLVCLMQTQAQTNVYHPININGATWLRDEAGSSYCCQYYYGYQSGDTIINALTYKKLHEVYGTIYPSCGSSQPCFTPSGPYGYIGALRQDSAAKKVYFISGTAPEYLLYDFNLQLGTVVQSTNTSTVTVKKIDSMSIDGSYRKRYFFYDTTYDQRQSFWVEGVGSSGGLLKGLFSFGVEGYYELSCFNHNQIAPPVVGGATCTIPLAGINKFTPNNYLKIYPNPAQNNFTVETNATEKQTLQLFDVNGKLVLAQTINEKTIIDAGNLNAGVYSLSIISNEGVLTKKLVIVR